MASDTTAIGGQGDSGLVDWKYFLDVVGDDQELAASVVDAFLQEAPQQMAAIHRSLDSADAKTLCRSAHSLKGSLRYFGARQAFDLALQLELAGKNDQLANLSSATRELDALLARILVILTEYLQRGGSP
jgi:HPt (histidine-containing phosphotransfer) domain-containing protein